MAVLRQPEQGQISLPAAPPIQQSQAGTVSPHPVINEQSNMDALPGLPSGSLIDSLNRQTSIAHTILGYEQEVAQTGVQTSQRDAYLSGQTQAMAGVAQNQLKADPLTSDWVNAGYHDVVGQLALANRSAQIMQDMPKLREQTPQQVQSYLEQSRAQLMPQLDNMSAAGKAQILPQILTADKSAMSTYTAQHSQYVVQQREAGIQGVMATSIANLNAAKGGSAQQYYDAAQKTMADMYSNIVMAPGFTPQVQARLLGQAADMAIKGGHPLLYDMMAHQPVRLADGSMGTMLGFLSLPDQAKLADDNAKGLATSKMYTQQNLQQKWASINAVLSDPTHAPPGFDTRDAYNTIFQMRDAGLLGEGQAGLAKQQELLNKVGTFNAKAVNQVSLATAYMSNNTGMMNNGMYSQSDYRDAFQRYASINPDGTPATSQQYTVKVISAVQAGNVDAAKLLAQNLASPMFQISMGKQVQPDAQQTLGVVLDTITKNKDVANRAVAAQLMSGLSPENQQAFSVLLDTYQSNGGDINGAQAAASEYMLGRSKLAVNGGTVQTPYNATRQADLQAMVKTYTSEGWMAGTWNAVFDSTRGALQPSRPFWTNKVLGDYGEANLQSAMSEALDRYGRRMPTATESAIQHVAEADVLSRQVNTSNGAFFLPPGSNLQSALHVDKAASNEEVGLALSKFGDSIKDSMGGATQYVSWRMDPDGTLVAQGLDKNGIPTLRQELPVDRIQPLLDVNREALAQHGNEMVGPGRTQAGSTGALVQYNGMNSAGQNPADMLALRKVLVDHEGVRDEQYVDSKGNPTNGVGINLNANKNVPPSTHWSKDEISATFMAASDQAAVIATKAMVANPVPINGPLQKQALFTMLGDLAYHQGNLGGAATNMLKALRTGDLTTAAAQLHATSAYQASQPSRQKWLDQQLQVAASRQPIMVQP